MPAPVHAVLVTWSSPAAAARLERALAALAAQTLPVDGLTIVVCGDPAPVSSVIDASGADFAVRAPERATFAGAVETAVDKIPDGRHAWILDEESAPEPGALALLTAALERQPSVAIAAPKLVAESDRRRIESFGVTMTRWGRTVELARGEFDQGQHDHADDVLGADARGMLVRSDVVRALVPDRALHGEDEGLDLGVRARLGGRRVALAPDARVAVAPSRRSRFRRAYDARVARLHRRLAYTPALLLPFQWILLLPLALWATAVAFAQKRPGRIAPEWMAAATVLVRFPSIARSRARVRAFRSGSWDQVDPLRMSRAELRVHQQASDDTRDAVRRPLHFFSGGGAWTVLAALVVSVVAFIALLTWPAIAGGALLPLRSTVAGLWSDAVYGLRPEGLADVGAADPFSTVLALLGSLWPAGPSFMLVVLWLLALPVAVLGGWFAATRFTERPAVRIGVGILWGMAPPLWDALSAGRPAAVILHLVLPWLVYTAVVAHRSWTTAGAASLLLAAAAASAPSLAPALAILWLLALALTIALHRRGIGRIVWLVIPTAAMFAPLVAEQFARGTFWGVFADPGAAVSFAHAGPAAVAAGVLDPSAWPRLLADLGLGFGGSVPAALFGVLLAPVVLLALAAPATRRTGAALIALLAAVAGLVTAIASLGVSVVAVEGAPVPLWPGSGLSLAWMGAVVAAAITMDAVRRPRLRGIAIAVAAVCVVVAVAPQVTALHRGATPLHSGEATTLPAYVTAEARGDKPIGTLILTPYADGSVGTDVVWGPSETLSGASTVARSAAAPTEDDEQLAQIAADIVSGSTRSVTEPLAEAGLSFVLLRETGAEQSSDQRVMALTAQSSMDQRSGFVRVGETERGVLWRVDGDTAPRASLTGAEATTAWFATAAQAALLIAALLLAIPTRRTRDDARRMPRVVGPRREETA